eukprot:Sdes_comp20896_c0_seq1m18033
MSDPTQLLKLSPEESNSYAQFFKLCDPQNKGVVSGKTAVDFFQKSGLPLTTLQTVWALSDTKNAGFLDKSQFFVALKLISLAQKKEELALKSLSLPTSLPIFSTIASSSPSSQSIKTSPEKPTPASSSAPLFSWKISEAQRQKYENHFTSLSPVHGFVSGEAARNFLLESKLPPPILLKIWELSDLDADGKFTKEEFFIAFHLVVAALSGQVIQDLKKELRISAKETAASAMPSLASLPSKLESSSASHLTTTTTTSVDLIQKQSSDWVVSPSEKASYDVYFDQADLGADGLIGGSEARNIFMASKVAPTILAHIWNLVDIHSIGRLNSEQFALAMHFINLKLKGADPPLVLTPAMIPPSLRSSLNSSGMNSPFFGSSSSLPGLMSAPQTAVNPAILENPAIKQQSESLKIANKALEDLYKEIETLRVERATKEKETVEKEAAAEQRRKEVASISAQLETFKEDFAELLAHRDNTERRLEVLNQQKREHEEELLQVKEQLSVEKVAVQNLQAKLEEEQAVVDEQARQLKEATDELERVQKQESELKSELARTQREIETVGKQLSYVESESKRTHESIKDLCSKNKIAKVDLINHRLAAERSAAKQQPPFAPDAFAGGDGSGGGYAEVSGEPLSSLPVKIPSSSVAARSAVATKASSGHSKTRKSSENPFSAEAMSNPFVVSASSGGLREESQMGATMDGKDPFGPSSFPLDFSSAKPVCGDAFGVGSSHPQQPQPHQPQCDQKAKKAEAAFSAAKFDPFSAAAGQFPEDPFQSVGHSFADPFAGAAFPSTLSPQPPPCSDPFETGASSGTMMQSSLSLDPFNPRADPFQIKPSLGIKRENEGASGGFADDLWTNFADLPSEEGSFPASKESMTEEEQIAWALAESERLERQKIMEQKAFEAEDLKKAVQESLRDASQVKKS